MPIPSYIFRDCVTEEPSRLLPAILVAVFVLGGIAGAGTILLTPPEKLDLDLQDSEPESEPEPKPEPEPGPEIQCSEGTILYQQTCVNPISNLTYIAPEWMYAGEGTWLEPIFDGEVTHWNSTCNSDDITLLENGSFFNKFNKL